MEYNITSILVPVNFNTEHIPLLRQSAELAAKHNAELILVHVIPISTIRIKKFTAIFSSPASLCYKLNERQNIIQTWKRWAENEYRIKVSCFLCYGDYKKQVIDLAYKTKCSIIGLMPDKTKTLLNLFQPDPLRWIISKSPCQVITFLKPFNSISEWRNVVIPITNFVPNARINTIYKLANEYKMKLYLISQRNTMIGKRQTNLHYLTEALSILKHSANIRVQCKYVTNGNDLSKAVFQYAHTIDADILMTNKAPAASVRMRIFAKMTGLFRNFRKNFKGKNFKKEALSAIPFWAGSFITGLIAVLYAKLFFWAEEGTLYIIKHAAYLLFFITPSCFIISWLIVKWFSPYSKGSGIPQVVASIELSNPKHSYKVNSLLSIRIIFIKIISSLIMVFGGGMIGREGPTIQIGASVFKKISDILPSWYPKVSKRNMIVTGAAAGLAAAFNTPLGGIVFAIEELTKTHFSFFKSALLTGVIISGLTALTMLGPYLYLGYPQLQNIPAWMILLVIATAILAGFFGSLSGRLILFLLGKINKLKLIPRFTYVLLSGVMIASFAFFIDAGSIGSGKEIMLTTLFSGSKHVEWYIPIMRITGSIISFCSGASGGIFAPSLCSGATIGSLVASLFHLPGNESNLLVLCGMAAFLTGITRSPFTSSILVIEMTNSHLIIFHLMLATLLANIIATAVSRHSIYDYLKDSYIREIHTEERQHKITESVAI